MLDPPYGIADNGSLALVGLNFTDSIQTEGYGDNRTYYELDNFNSITERILLSILFGIEFFVGIVGNGTLIYTVLRNRNMRVVPNIYIVSLSCGDFLFILIAIPFIACDHILPEWPFGEMVCKAIEYLKTVSLGVSVFMLSAVSADRYLAIGNPITAHKKRAITRALSIACCLWLLAFLLAIPDFNSSKVVQFSSNITLGSHKVCILYPRSNLRGHLPSWYSEVMVMLKFFVFFLIPLILIGAFYILMARILINTAHQIPGDGQTSLHRHITARLKIAKAVLMFVLLFVICWLPRHIYLLCYYYYGEYDQFWYIFRVTSSCLALINSCVNPFALYFLSKQFRSYYNRYLFCCFTRDRYGNIALRIPGPNMRHAEDQTIC